MKNVIVSVLAGLALMTVGCSASQTGTSASSTAFVVKGLADNSAAPSIASILSGTVVGNPSYFKMKMYQLHLSANEDCSSPVLVAGDGVTGVDKVMTSNPTLFSGEPPAGTYKCLLLKMADVIEFKSETNNAQCNTTDTFSNDLYRTGCGSDIFKDETLTNITCSGDDTAPIDNKATFVITRNPAAAIARGFSQHQVLQLGSDLVSPGQVTMRLKTKDTVELSDPGTGMACRLLPFEMSFE